MKNLKRILALCLTLALMLPILAAPADASSGDFYPQYSGSSGSIVDALKAVGYGADSSFSGRAKIAAANGISTESAYRGSSAQNIQMLRLLKAGTLRRPGSGSGTTAPTPSPTSNANTLVFPVNNGLRIAYFYGKTPEYGGSHNGLDIHSYGDDFIYAAAAGRVVSISNSCPHNNYGGKCAHWTSYGNMIKIQGSDGRIYYYGHLKQGSMAVKVGDKVQAGQRIATMGSSGWSTGKHLHFEVRASNGSTVLNVNPATGNYRYKGSTFSYVNGPYIR